METTTGIIFDIQRFSVHDGPGIRTLVFLKGCPLRCSWCSNPEGQSTRPQLLYITNRCRHCGRCATVCPQQVVTIAGVTRRFATERCDACGHCVAACVFNALEIKGKTVSVAELMPELRKDATHYRTSGGGVTLSGGEALLQPAFSAAILAACRVEGWDTAIETTGCIPWTALETVLPHTRLVLLDIKHFDSAKHREYTGLPNGLILENARRLAAYEGVDLVVRVPVIPGFNDTREEILAIADVVSGLQRVRALHLLAYHRLGENKYDYLSMPHAMECRASLSPSSMEYLRAAAAGVVSIPCIIGG